MAATLYSSHESFTQSRAFSNDQYFDGAVYDWLDLGMDDFGYKSNLDCPWPALYDQRPEESYYDLDTVSLGSGSVTPPPSSVRSLNCSPSQKDGESARPHYATEKKYRQRLNDKFKALQTCLTDVDQPLCSQLAEEKTKHMEALQSGRIGRSVKQRKSLVLALALEYVRSLEMKYKQTNTEIETYQQLLYTSAAQLANALVDENGQISRVA